MQKMLPVQKMTKTNWTKKMKMTKTNWTMKTKKMKKKLQLNALLFLLPSS